MWWWTGRPTGWAGERNAAAALRSASAAPASASPQLLHHTMHESLEGIFPTLYITNFHS